MQHLFKWNQRKAWEKTMFKLLADDLDDAVLARVKQINPRYLLDDDFAWLNDSVTEIKGGQKDIPALLAAKLASTYQGIIAFHGCRPTSLEFYRKHGLLPSDTEAIRQQARKLFGDIEAVNSAIADIGGHYVSHNRGTIWLCLTKETFFLNGHDHYLLTGSEYFSAIANRIGQSQKLRAIGTPTIIECVVVSSQLPEDYWHSMGRHMLEDWFARFLRPNDRRPICTSCVNVTTPIPTERIIQFHQFKEVKHGYSWRDPLTGKKCVGERIRLSPL
jgi:hypothetical protein